MVLGRKNGEKWAGKNPHAPRETSNRGFLFVGIRANSTSLKSRQFLAGPGMTEAGEREEARGNSSPWTSPFPLDPESTQY